MPYAHSAFTLDLEDRWDFNFACRALSVYGDRADFHAYAKRVGVKGPQPPELWRQLYDSFRSHVDWLDLQATVSDTLAARHW